MVRKILLDCGLYQGYRMSEERNYAPFPYDAKSVDFLILGHAHLDHTGRIPKLVKMGFRGQIFATSPTKDLANLVLDDSEKLMREEAERDKHSPLYSLKDVSAAMQLFKTLPYGDNVEISKGIRLTFKNAGHILGSAITLLEADGQKLVYTSDIGNTPSNLLDPPEFITDATYAICESTYGGRVHEDINQRTVKLSQAISTTIATNGILMIPSFAIERTQELLHDIEHFCSAEGCEKPTFYLDSPLASKVTAVFAKYPKYLSSKIRIIHKEHDFFGLERLNITLSAEDSKAINSAPNPKIIIAGSGMMNGGRILHHMKRYLANPNNSMLIVGYQAKGTRGRRIFDGEKEINIFGRKYRVNANIKAIGSYSAHADMPQLVNWLSKIHGCRKVFIVHGENDQSLTLSRKIVSELKIETIIPQQGESYEL